MAAPVKPRRVVLYVAIGALAFSAALLSIGPIARTYDVPRLPPLAAPSKENLVVTPPRPSTPFYDHTSLSPSAVYPVHSHYYYVDYYPYAYRVAPTSLMLNAASLPSVDLQSLNSVVPSKLGDLTCSPALANDTLRALNRATETLPAFSPLGPVQLRMLGATSNPQTALGSVSAPSIAVPGAGSATGLLRR